MVGILWRKSMRTLKRLCANNTILPRVFTKTSRETATTGSEGQFNNCHNDPPSTAAAGYTSCINSTGNDLITLRPHQQSALDKIADASKGQIIVPTGGGKTLIAIMDAIRLLNASVTPQTIVVVAPRILLANQLCEEYMEVIKQEVAQQVIPAHIHSGDTSHFSTTKVDEIKCFEGMMQTAQLHRIYFTTITHFLALPLQVCKLIRFILTSSQ